MRYLHLLTILFIGLKLTEHIAWSWWLVLLPSYIGLAILGVTVVGLIMLAVAEKAKNRA